MSHEGAVARPFQHLIDQPKPTFAVLSQVIIDAANSISINPTREGGPLAGVAFAKLRDQLFLSPRLTQWQLGYDDNGKRGYWLKITMVYNMTNTVTVGEDKVVLSLSNRDNPRHFDIVNGLPAATLFKSIQDAQDIVRPKGLSPKGLGPKGLGGMAASEEEEFFTESDPEYIESAGLDVALQDISSDSVEDDTEDDAELIVESAEPEFATSSYKEVQAAEINEELAEPVEREVAELRENL